MTFSTGLIILGFTSIILHQYDLTHWIFDWTPSTLEFWKRSISKFTPNTEQCSDPIQWDGINQQFTTVSSCLVGGWYIHMRTMVLVYLATKLADFVRANVGVHIPAPWIIWDTYPSEK